MTKYTLLLSVVPHDKGELITKAAVSAGSFGGTVLMGRTISASAFLNAIGIGERSSDIVYILTDEEKKNAIRSSIEEACSTEKSNFGCMFNVSADNLLKTGNISEGENQMNENKSHKLITVILNKGYADDAMAAARKAGAGGGTVINARGTAREDDAKFFGMHIIPEKEMLQIIVEKEKEPAVLEAIRTLPCLAEPGSGIAFCADVDSFTILGKKD